MAKKKNEESQIEVELDNNSKDDGEAVRTSFPNIAIGMHAIKVENGATQYVIVEIPFDPATGDVGFIQEISRDIREDSIDKFKMRVIDNKFFGGE